MMQVSQFFVSLCIFKKKNGIMQVCFVIYKNWSLLYIFQNSNEELDNSTFDSFYLV